MLGSAMTESTAPPRPCVRVVAEAPLGCDENLPLQCLSHHIRADGRHLILLILGMPEANRLSQLAGAG